MLKNTFLIASLLVASLYGASAQKMIVSGSYADNIIVIDKSTQEVESSINLPYLPSVGGECNSVSRDNDGNILFSYKKGARLIDSSQEVIWDFRRSNPSEEVQSVVSSSDGYMVAICGSPSRFVFLNNEGQEVYEVEYDLGIADSHSQFRQVRLSERGTILIPVMGRGTLLEIDYRGRKVQEIAIGGSPFSAYSLSRRRVLVSGGFGVKVVDLVESKVVEELVSDSVGDIPLSFVTEARLLESGNLIISNWQGHSNTTDAQLLEIDSRGNLVWSFAAPNIVRYVSTFEIF